MSGFLSLRYRLYAALIYHKRYRGKTVVFCCNLLYYQDMINHSEGSTWLKCDIHVHTPASHDYLSGGVGYQGVADAINASDIDVVAITDHWTLDGYRELKKLVSEEKLLLPGIEIKLDKNIRGKTGDKGGFHAQVIFPENTDPDDIQDKFLNQLQLCEHDGKLPTRKDLIALGKTLTNAGSTQAEQWEKGCQQAYVDFKKVVEKAHQLGGIVVIPYERHGGFEGIDPNNESAMKGNILKGTDIIETASSEVRTAFYEHPGIIKAAGKKTPAFKSSDAHKPDDIGRSFTWVKGERSFEGLKQSLYFPKERISYEDAKPSYAFPRIKSLTLKNTDGVHALHSLDGVTIPLNDNLTTVIGHPSIGKSTLVEAIAYLFNTETATESGEELSKIENLQEINPELVIEAQVASGGSSNTISRDFEGDFDGDITVDEVPITYLNQGYIDRTARDPKKVEALIEERMDTSELEGAAVNVQRVLNKLERHRQNYLKRAQLLESQRSIKTRQAAADKFFEISKSPEYAKLEERREELSTKESTMQATVEAVDELSEVFDSYEDTLGNIQLDVDDIQKLYPSIDASELSDILTFSAKAKTYLSKLSGKLEKSDEAKQVAKDKKQLSIDMKALFAKEKITYTSTLWDEKNKQVQLLAGLKRANDNDIANCEGQAEEFANELKTLQVEVASRDTARTNAMLAFNTGLSNVEVRYDQESAEAWLVSVLTDEAKAAWDEYTPQTEKDESKFRKPSSEDVRNMLQHLYDTGKSPDEVREYLLECLESNVLPVTQDHEFIKWLFGDKSQVIKDFLAMRLREYVPRGQLGLYYDGKNIAREGLSYTERCGALLEIIIEKGVEPLIIDQPEDNLGSSYITEVLIPTILKKKHSRQFILISHNPNTVVLSDSDLVVAFDRDGNTDGIELHTGAIESEEMKGIICDIIEGGTEAFKVRFERYKINTTE